MSESEHKFYKFKNQMDKKTFDYDTRQPWEDEIDNAINGYSFGKLINDFFMLIQPKEETQHECNFDDTQRL